MLWYTIVLTYACQDATYRYRSTRSDYLVVCTFIIIIRGEQEAERDEPGMELHIDHDWSLTLPRLLEFGGGIHFHKI